VPRSDQVVWRNWARNQVARPVAIEHPASEDELVGIVKHAAAEGQTVKVVGSGHSFTGIALTTGRLVVLDHYTRVLEVDTERHRVTVQAGITLEQLNLELDRRGLAMPNLGDIAYQTVAGATSTSTHGTGVTLPGLAAQVVGLRLVTADGTVLACSADEEPEVFHAARVGLGALGIVSTVTLQVVPAFNLHVLEQPMRVDALLDDLDAHVEGNDHFEFFWVPHTGWALTKANNRTTEPLAPRGRLKAWRDDYLLENYGFGAVCRIGRMRPQWIPRLAKALPSSGSSTYVDRSYRVFASPRLVRFYEMEYAVPREAGPEVLNRIRRFVEDEQLLLNFPVEVRFTAPDDIPLSTSSGRASCYLAIHVFQGMAYRPYFEGVERIMDEYDGRPHWGKLHFQTADTLAPRYPQWDRFQAVRRRLDPEGRFANDYSRRVLGS
jgi:L-gulonolactone oxidase